MEPKTYSDFYSGLARYHASNPGQRYGQAVFNYAYGFGRELTSDYDGLSDNADAMRGTKFDCFYDDRKAEEFITRLGLDSNG